MSDRPLRQFVFETFLPQNLKARSPETYRQYGFAVSDFAKFLGREPTLTDLQDATIAAFMAWMLGPARKVSARTTNKRSGALKAVWKWAASRRLIETFPTIGNIPEPQRIPRAWREDELVKLINAARTMRGIVGGDVPAWRWWVAIHAWWWNTAERTTATLRLPVDGIDLEYRTAYVPAEIRKGGLKPRVYKLWPDTVEMFRMILPPHTKPRTVMFPWDKHQSSFYNHYKKLLVKAGLPHDRYCKPHRMRVSRASWIKKEGGDPTRELGHESEATTRKHYLDPSLLEQDETKLFRPW